jgi:hypothetical protein
MRSMLVRARPTSLARWCGLLAVLAAALPSPALAQPPSMPNKVMSWQTADATGQSCYGILGEVVRPGVYAATDREVTLQDLVQQAGGLTGRSSPTVRIVRRARTVQGIFFSASGRDLLQPHDVVVVDALSMGRSFTESANAASAPPGVWVCLDGVLDRPAIVCIPEPRQARLLSIMLALGQSKELAQSVRPVLPTRSTWMASTDAPVPSGTVLVFDRRLLVTQNLPFLPDVVPMSPVGNAAPSTAMMVAEPAVPLPETGLAVAPPPPTDTTEPGWSHSFASQSRSPVEAIAVPFPSPPNEPTAASPASLPVPGSRFQEQLDTSAPKPKQASAKKRAIDPKLAADTSVEIIPAPPDEDDGSLPDAVTNSSTLSLWHMLGISGTVACLIGIAVATRKYFDRTETASFQSFDRSIAVPQPTPLAASKTAEHEPRFEIAAPPVPAPSITEPNDLDEILRGCLPIVTEAVQFPLRFPLQRPHDPMGAVYRLDVADRRPVPMPHAASRAPIGRTAAHEDQPSDVIPRPHLLKKPRLSEGPASRREAVPAHVESRPSESPGLSRGTPLERALSQLQGGPPS